ncbi:hypothetical protein A9Q84_16850 [Halobacteriovorax marinus]|uniref:Secreted protein n=1 Tax=Halobacteriovorax marinus TaxID=97084 RepID=A0A1Y5F8J2_9BACT|nr:hypothetical protein A9Q84_16850 [Halobacteriovorax marinus]
MKTIIMLALIALSASASAHKFVTTIVPTMNMESGFEFQSVKVTNICQLEDGSFKTVEKIKNRCVKYSRNFRNAQEYRDARHGCRKKGSLHLFSAETKQSGYCAEYGRDNDNDYGCLRVAYNTVAKPLTYLIKKVRINTRGGENRDDRVIDEVLSTTSFTIPSCN